MTVRCKICKSWCADAWWQEEGRLLDLELNHKHLYKKYCTLRKKAARLNEKAQAILDDNFVLEKDRQ